MDVRVSLGCLVLCSLVCISKCEYPFMNTSLPWAERVDDVVGRLTLDEIILQMARIQPAPAIERLGIKYFDWATECLAGDAGAGFATSFPQALGLAATFSPSVLYRIAEATGVEVRAKFNNYTKAGLTGYHRGIACFSPVVNIMRHPLWGRNQETYGEDPYMSGLYAQHYVAGLQGNHPRYVKASSGCKSFDLYAGPDNIPVPRSSFDAKVSMRDWRLTHLPAFRMCVEGGTYSLMCSYNAINGIPSCGNKFLLTDILRGEWGFTGYVVSDAFAIEIMISGHHYVNNSVDAAALAVNAGCNIELGAGPHSVFLDIGKAVQAGKISMETLKERMKPLFYTRMRLGEFDPPEMNPYSNINITVIESEPHVALSRETAIKSFVLLKNNNQFLPVKYPSSYQKVAIVGPMANNKTAITGQYSANTFFKYITTPYLGLKSVWPGIDFAEGCSTTPCTDYNSGSIQTAVTGSSLVFVCLGTGNVVEGERNDRSDMNLPGSQLQLLQDTIKFANGAPVVVLMFNAGPVDITWAEQSDAVSSILACFFPAQETGNALLQVILGEESPAGRLPYTWYRHANQTPAITNYTMHERTYRYFTGEPIYPFGYGLSYTTFSYTDLTIGNPSIEAGQDQVISVTLHNSGQVVSDEVVQVYISWVNASTPMPQLQIAGFDRLIGLNPQEASVTVKFVIKAQQMAQWDDLANQFFVQAGDILVYAGGQQPNQQKSVGSNVLTESFKVTGFTYL